MDTRQSSQRVAACRTAMGDPSLPPTRMWTYAYLYLEDEWNGGLYTTSYYYTNEIL